MTPNPNLPARWTPVRRMSRRVDVSTFVDFVLLLPELLSSLLLLALLGGVAGPARGPSHRHHHGVLLLMCHFPVLLGNRLAN